MVVPNRAADPSCYSRSWDAAATVVKWGSIALGPGIVYYGGKYTAKEAAAFRKEWNNTMDYSRRELAVHGVKVLGGVAAMAAGAAWSYVTVSYLGQAALAALYPEGPLPTATPAPIPPAPVLPPLPAPAPQPEPVPAPQPTPPAPAQPAPVAAPAPVPTPTVHVPAPVATHVPAPTPVAPQAPVPTPAVHVPAPAATHVPEPTPVVAPAPTPVAPPVAAVPVPTAPAPAPTCELGPDGNCLVKA